MKLTTRSLIYLLLCFQFPLSAVTTKYVEHNSYFQFVGGQFNGISLDDQGFLLLSPSFNSIHGFSESFVWKMAETSKGDILCATGNDGKIRIISGTNSKVFHSFESSQVTAIAIDKDDTVYAGVSPSGTVYRISADGKSSKVHLISESSHIWDLKIDSKGNLFVAAGDDAQLLKVDRAGKKESVFKPAEGNFVSLAIDKHDNVYVAGADSGLVYKVTPSGEKSVVFDTGSQEITAIEIDTAGNLYVATSPGASSQLFVKPQEQKQELKPQATSIFEEEKFTSFQTKKKAMNTVYKVNSNLDFTKIIELENIVFLSLVKDSDDNIFVGCGNNGDIFKISKDELVTKIFNIDSSQVLSLLISKKKRLYAGTGNLGSVYMVDPVYAKSGSYYSEIIDAGFLAVPGSLSWVAETPPGTSVKFQTRSGNSSIPDPFWSQWSDDVTIPGKSIQSPRARFFQYRLTLMSEKNNSTPKVTSINLSYRQNNQKPVIQSVNMEFPGEKTDPKKITKIKQPLAKNERRLYWEATDPNEDELLYSVFFKDQAFPQWMLLKDGIKDTSYVFDSLVLPDGYYHFKVVASDMPSNTVEDALSAEISTSLLVIDNAPPALQNVKVEKQGESRVKISGTAADLFSDVQSVEYSYNTSSWVFILPEDRIFDSKTEVFSFAMDRTKGMEILILRLTDKNGNSVTYKVKL